MREIVSLHEFFVYLYSGVPTELFTTFNAIAREGERLFSTYTTHVDNFDMALAWIEGRKKSHDCYFRPSVLASPPQQGRGKESDTVGSMLLWADLDIYTVHKTIEETVAYLERGIEVPKPTAIIMSGGGIQALWKLTTFQRDILMMKGRNRWLQMRLGDYGADGVSDYARILRIPYTYNYKKDMTRKTDLLVFEPSRLYTLEDFLWIPEPTPPAAPTRQHIGQQTPLLTDEFLSRLEEQSPTLAQRILSQAGAEREKAHRTDKGTIDNSRNDFYIARMLFRHGYDEETVYAVLTHPYWFSGQKYRETGRDDYVLRTIEKAKHIPPVDTNQFFDGKKFIPIHMLNYIKNQGTPFLMHNMELYVYDPEDGVYRPNGEAYIRHEVAAILGERWRPTYASDTVTLCKDSLYSDALEELRNLQAPERKPLAELVLNTRGGMMNLATGECTPHDPLLRSIVQVRATYHPLTTGMKFPVEQFVEENLPSDSIAAWWEWVGYHFLNDTRFRRAMYIVGPPKTGKSVLLGILERFLGAANVTAHSLQSLCDDRFYASDLVGKIGNIYNDLEMVEVKKPGRFKIFVSGERQSVEIKYVPAFDVYLTTKHTYSANGYVPVTDPDEAYVSRWLMIPLTKQFNEGGVGLGDKKANVQLLDLLSTEENMSAMLYHARQGLVRLCTQEHFTIGKSMEDTQNEYHAFLDSMFDFLYTMTEPLATGFVPKQELYAAYCHYCGEVNRGKLQERKFFMRMKEEAKKRHIHDGRKMIDGKGYYGFFGLRLLPRVEESPHSGKLVLVKKPERSATL